MFLYVANGVTTVRGMLGQDGHMELRRKANAGEIVAPTLYMPDPASVAARCPLQSRPPRGSAPRKSRAGIS